MKHNKINYLSSTIVFVLAILYLGCGSPEAPINSIVQCHKCNKVIEGTPAQSVRIFDEDQSWCSNECFRADGNSITGETEEEEQVTCNICSQKFTGRGYELAYSGECKEVDEDHQGFLCSCSCALKARQNFNKAYDDVMGK
jgi:hypothetical protein